MNKHEASVHATITRLRAFAEQNQTKIDSIAALKNAFVELFEVGEEIEKKTGNQNANIKGMTKEKKELKKDLAQETVVMAGAIYNYALITKNIPLATEMDMETYQILRLNDEIIVPIISKVYDFAKENVVVLKTYGINEVKLTDYKTMLDLFSDKKQQPKAGISQKHSQTSAIELLTKKAVQNIDHKLNKLMLQFQKTDTEMYVHYLSSCKIEKTGSKKNNHPPPDEKDIPLSN